MSDPFGERTMPVQVQRLPLAQLIVIRGPGADRRFGEWVLRRTGMPLPSRPNSRVQADGAELLWIGPDEWWWLDPHQWLAGRRSALLTDAPVAMAAVEVGAAYARIGVHGAGAAAALSAGCPIDLHPRALPGDAVVGTLYFKGQIRLMRHLDPAGFSLLVTRSVAPYVASLLCGTAAVVPDVRYPG